MTDAVSKYRSIRTTINGRTFASAKEAKRAGELELAQRAGVISNLEYQPRYRCEVNGVKVCDYVADFRYTQAGQVVVEDVKGFRTPVYRLKAKLVLALFGIAIRET